jgi:hypothetical protein
MLVLSIACGLIPLAWAIDLRDRAFGMPTG